MFGHGIFYQQKVFIGDVPTTSLDCMGLILSFFFSFAFPAWRSVCIFFKFMLKHWTLIRVTVLLLPIWTFGSFFCQFYLCFTEHFGLQLSNDHSRDSEENIKKYFQRQLWFFALKLTLYKFRIFEGELTAFTLNILRSFRYHSCWGLKELFTILKKLV